MGKSFQSLLEHAKTLHLSGLSSDDMRSQLSKDGWDLDTIDRGLWQIGIKDRKNMYFGRRLKRIGIAAMVLAGFAGFCGLVVLWDRDHKSQPQSEVQGASIGEQLKEQVADYQKQLDEKYTPQPAASGDTVNSEEAGIRFSYSDDWIVSTYPYDQTYGTYQWQIEHIENTPLKQELQQKYGVSGADSTNSSAADYALINDPLARKLIVINITVTKGEENGVEKTIDEWKRSVDSAVGQMGYAADDFVAMKKNGLDGYSYHSSLDYSQIHFETKEFVFIDSLDRRIEISIHPYTSKHDSEIKKILDSFEIL